MYTTQVQRTTIQTKTIETIASNRPRVLATFVIDVSGSMMGTPLKNAMDGAYIIFDKILWDSDRLEIINFASTAFRQLHMKSKRQVVWDREIRAINVAKTGSTALYSAIVKAIEEMPKDHKYDNCHRELIILTDGANNTGRRTHMEAKNLINRSGFKYFHCTLIGVNISQHDEITMRDLVSNQHSTYIPCSVDGIIDSFSFIRTQISVRIEQTVITQTNGVVQVTPSIMSGTIHNVLEQPRNMIQPAENKRFGGTAIGYCVAVQDFRGTGKSDLWFNKGETIDIFFKDEQSKRWRGESRKTKRNGWFPSTLVRCE